MIAKEESLTRLRARIKELELEVSKLEADRDKFRSHFAGRYKWFWELVEKDQAPNMKWMVKDDSMFLRRVQWWYFDV